MIGEIHPSPQVPSGQLRPASRAPTREREDDALRASEDRPRQDDDAAISRTAAVRNVNPGGESAFAAQLAAHNDADRSDQETDDKPKDEAADKSTNAVTGDAAPTDEERQQINELAARDREVRAHEAAHAAVGGAYAGAPRYTYESGPNGRRYAVGGEVPIDASPVAGDPEATIQKLRTVKRAALAPAEPSSTDRQIATSAEAGIRKAQQEANHQRTEETREANNSDEPTDPLALSAAPPNPLSTSQPEHGPKNGPENGQIGNNNRAQRPPGLTLSLVV